MKLMKKDIRSNMEVTTYFALESMQLRKSRKRGPFLAMDLFDRTGRINGYLWTDPLSAAGTLKDKTIVKVRGTSRVVNDSLLINIERIREASKEETDIRDYLEVVPGGISFWHKGLESIAGMIRDAHCRALVQSFLNDECFLELFITSPGGLLIHHNYVGGLLEHTVCAMEFVSWVADRNPALVNRDILLTGAFLHDIGKTREIYWEIAKEYTTDGKLLGHIALGLLILEEKIRELGDFPSDLANMLRHMIISHHGIPEHGSPVRPATPEALVLHLMEAADAKINHLYCFLENSDGKSDWSQFDRILQSEIYQKRYISRQTEYPAVAAV